MGAMYGIYFIQRFCALTPGTNRPPGHRVLAQSGRALEFGYASMDPYSSTLNSVQYVKVTRKHQQSTNQLAFANSIWARRWTTPIKVPGRIKTIKPEPTPIKHLPTINPLNLPTANAKNYTQIQTIQVNLYTHLQTAPDTNRESRESL